MVALAAALGRPATQAQMERLCSDAIDRGGPLREAQARASAKCPVLSAALSEDTLEALFDAPSQRVDADAMNDRALAEWRAA